MPLPFFAAMIHVTISPSKEQELREKMRALGIYESDLVETFVRSGGKGGQHVNKTSTCVQLKHIPSGLEVKCSRERSQALNRFLARRILTAKIDELARGRKSEERQRVEKIRRQKRKRSKRAKEKMLADKKKHSAKKLLRKRPGNDRGES